VSDEKVIDYRYTYWGHNLMIKDDKDGLLRGALIHRTPVKVGDKLVWNASYGTATGRVVECRWLGDPDDMYQVAVEVILRESPTGEVLWPVEEEG
jgi:hypothetical protein